MEANTTLYTEYSVVHPAIYSMTLSLGWWITNWNLLHMPSNQHILIVRTYIYVLLNYEFVLL
jgi:hypothetical protein